MRSRLRRWVLVLGLASSVLAPALPAGALAPAAGAIGFDVSYPQCALSSPSGAFGIVGVTNGTLFSTNPCLTTEASWASATGVTPQFYVTAADMGPSSTHWPKGQSTPVPCTTTNGTACSYDYGWNGAAAAYATVATTGIAATTWWLDVETSESWQINIPGIATALATANDAAALAGMVAYLQSQGQQVGLYAAPAQWNSIIGSSDVVALSGVPTMNLANLPEWLAGFASPSAASAGCLQSAFAGGAITLTQAALPTGDEDTVCAVASNPSTPTVAAAGPGALNISWTASSTPAATYRVSATPGDASCTTTLLTCTLSGLPAGVVSVSVVASASGLGGSFPATASANVTNVPSAPTLQLVFATPGLTVLAVQLSSSGGLPLKGYQYRLDGGAWRPGALRAGRLLLNHLRAGATLSVQVRAVNALGEGPASAALRVHVA